MKNLSPVIILILGSIFGGSIILTVPVATASPGCLKFEAGDSVRLRRIEVMETESGAEAADELFDWELTATIRPDDDEGHILFESYQGAALIVGDEV